MYPCALQLTCFRASMAWVLELVCVTPCLRCSRCRFWCSQSSVLAISFSYKFQVVSACKEGKIDEASLEARFFRYGGVRAVTALAAAGADDNIILGQLEGLGDEELGFFLKSIESIEWHPDLVFMAEATDRKRPSISTKKMSLVRRRPPRTTKRASADKQTHHKSTQHFSRRARRSGPNAAERSNIITQDHVLSSEQFLSYPDSSEVVKGISAAGCCFSEENMAGLLDFDDLFGPLSPTVREKRRNSIKGMYLVVPAPDLDVPFLCRSFL